MAINGVSPIRISGLASGMDTDTMVTNLMKIQRIPMDRVIQNKQINLWKQDAYRSITSTLNDLKNTYMDVLKPSTNMRAQTQYKKFSTSIINSSGASSTSFTATGASTASAGSHTVTVKSLATYAKETSTSNVTSALQTGGIKSSLSLADKKMNITLDGVTKEITFTSDINITDQATGDAFAVQFQSLISDAFGKGIGDAPKVVVLYDDTSGKISFDTGAGASKLTFNTGTTNDALTTLGITNNSSNRINTSSTLSELKNAFRSELAFYDDGGIEKLIFSINAKEFTFTSSTKLSTVINTINNDADANVNFSYDNVSDKFIITSKETGEGKKISITNTWGSFFGESNATSIDPNIANFGTSGEDAVVTIDGQDLVRNSNTFTEGDITYSLKKADPLDENIVTLNIDVDTVYNNISAFISKYNEVLDTINNKLNEKYDKSYLPLSDEQKESMNETDIKNWEDKAKTGLLRNDSTLQKIVSDMRSKLIDSVDGVNISLFNIGISSQSYTDRGKLTINETKLKAAIANDADSVMNLFSQQSVTNPDYDRKATLDQRTARYKDEGMINRLYDIISDNTSIMMDSNKKKGFLLEKAGMVGDSTANSSVLSKLIYDQVTEISKWETTLSKKESSYYAKFTAMEKAMSSLNSQSSWIASQLSSFSSY